MNDCMNDVKNGYFYKIFGSQSNEFLKCTDCKIITFVEKLFIFLKERNIDADFWVDLLKNIPELAEICPWQQFSGREWAKLLKTHPQFSEYCDWWKLGNSDWLVLLNKQPQFVHKLKQLDMAIVLLQLRIIILMRRFNNVCWKKSMATVGQVCCLKIQAVPGCVTGKSLMDTIGFLY